MRMPAVLLLGLHLKREKRSDEFALSDVRK